MQKYASLNMETKSALKVLGARASKLIIIR